MIIDKLASYEVAYGISVGAGATMAVTDSTFSRNGNAVENAEITVAAGGHLTAAGSSFSLDNVSLASRQHARRRRLHRRHLQHHADAAGRRRAGLDQ